ncbi:hypothetical protein [Bacteroides sp.]|nr:hypothetical protein [Bacteroides sp.]MDD3040555.1 hypothetical protein [Bacteroides sp.]
MTELLELSRDIEPSYYYLELAVRGRFEKNERKEINMLKEFVRMKGDKK